jgi:hypothetical protein
MQRVVLMWTVSMLCGACAVAPGSRGAGPTDAPATAEADPAAARTAQDATGAEARGVKFTVRTPQQGSVRIDDSTEELRLELSRGQGKKTVTVVQHTVRRVKTRTTVLAANDIAVTKKRVEYVDGMSEERLGDRTQRLPNPLLGKTYVLQLRDGRLRATGPEGQPISEYEHELLAAQNPHLGKPSQFAAMLPSRPLDAGEQITPDPAVLQQVYAGTTGEVRDATIVFEGLSDQGGQRLGRFRVRFTVVDLRDQTRVQTQLSGTVLLQVDTCWPVEVSLAGPVQIEAQPPDPARLRGQGEARTAVHTTYQ